jgi:hypothetical protein
MSRRLYVESLETRKLMAVDAFVPTAERIEDVPAELAPQTDTISSGDENGLIGMLLPAVQKVREAAARASAAGEKTFDVNLEIDLGDGSKPLEIKLQDVLVSSYQSGGTEILIGLLVPAVRAAQEAAAGSHALYQDIFIPANHQDTNEGAAVDAFFKLYGDDAGYWKVTMTDVLVSS